MAQWRTSVLPRLTACPGSQPARSTAGSRATIRPLGSRSPGDGSTTSASCVRQRGTNRLGPRQPLQFGPSKAEIPEPPFIGGDFDQVAIRMGNHHEAVSYTHLTLPTIL